jgi:hypothetical protein
MKNQFLLLPQGSEILTLKNKCLWNIQYPLLNSKLLKNQIFKAEQGK